MEQSNRWTTRSSNWFSYQNKVTCKVNTWTLNRRHLHLSKCSSCARQVFPSVDKLVSQNKHTSFWTFQWKQSQVGKCLVRGSRRKTHQGIRNLLYRKFCCMKGKTCYWGNFYCSLHKQTKLVDDNFWEKLAVRSHRKGKEFFFIQTGQEMEVYYHQDPTYYHPLCHSQPQPPLPNHQPGWE